MPYEQIDPMMIEVLPLAARKSLISIEEAAVDPAVPPPAAPAAAARIDALAERILEARRRGAAVMLCYGAHLVKNGCSPLVNALIAEGFVTHAATQGAGIIHDWEFAYQGASSEHVREGVEAGSFGAWEETGFCLNLALLVRYGLPGTQQRPSRDNTGFHWRLSQKHFRESYL